MDIKATGFEEVIKYIDTQSERVVKAFIDDLNYVGLQVVTYVRDRSGIESWYDQTGNLRSSIGYVVIYDGNIIGEGGFEMVDGPRRVETFDDGSQIGQSFAESFAEKYVHGYALVIVAGMEYASYVEDMESKDVLKSGQFQAEALIKNLVDAYNNNQWSKAE